MKSNQSSVGFSGGIRLGALVPALIVVLGLAFLTWLQGRSSISAHGNVGSRVTPPIGLLFTVNSTADTPDSIVGNGSCADSQGRCTLRAAIQEANAQPSDDSIDFDIPTTDPGWNGTGWVINLNSALPNLSTNLNISGPGPFKYNLTVKRNSSSQFRIFTVTSSAIVSISTMTILSGSIAGNGGCLSNGGTGTVSITDCTIGGGTATASGGINNNGGGISNDSTGTITLTGVQVDDNTASGFGGGLSNNSTGTVNVLNSYFGGNSANSQGGGIENSKGGIVNVTASTLFFNHAGNGGGIDNLASGTVNVTNSTITGNVVSSSGSADNGGGIFNTSTGTVTVTNSTISSNTGEGLTNNGISAFNVRSSIVALNTGGPSRDLFGNFNSGGFNLIGKRDGSTGFNTPTDQTGTVALSLDPKLDPNGLQDNGNSTSLTIALRCGSPAIDKGTSVSLTMGTLSTDQRGSGFPRTFNDTAIPPATGGDETDIGAFELQNPCTSTVTVNTTADDHDLSPGDGLCDSDFAAGQQCTLRAAIEELAFRTGDTAINFSIPTSDPGFSNGTWTIGLKSALPDLNYNLNINGPGPSKTNLWVSRNSSAQFRIFTVTGAANVSLSNLTIVNGSVAGKGGGISHGGTGLVTITNCVIGNNTTTGNTSNSGGGISNDNTGTITITDSFVEDNSATGQGGGISNNFTGAVNVVNGLFLGNAAGIEGGGVNNAAGGIVNVTGSLLVNNHALRGGGLDNNGSGTLSVTNSTVGANYVNAVGADNGCGVYNGSGGTVNVSNSTISGNNGEGLANNGAGPFNVKSSIVALNMAVSSSRDLFGAFNSSGFNLIGTRDGSTGFTGATDQTGTVASPFDPKLDPSGLRNNGGSNPTIALLCGSPAIDKGTSVSLTMGTLSTDQRGTGFLRKFDDPNIPNGSGDGTDIGAFEVQQACATPTPTPTPTPSPTPTPTPTPTPATLQFDASVYIVGEGDGHATITVTRTGDTSGAASVDYKTTDTDTFTVGCADKVNNHGSAYGRCDFATVVGTLSFAGGDTSKTFAVPIIDDSYAEGNETFGVALSNPAGASLGANSTATVTVTDNEISDGPNPIFQTNPAGVSFFVRQHYLDFLGREPEQGEPWSAILNGCSDQFNTNPNSPSAGCDRIIVSGSFFGSPEFSSKGIYIIDFYRVALNRLPTYVEFSQDLASVTGATGAETNAKRAAFAANFVLRPEFTGFYGAMNNTTFVNALMTGDPNQGGKGQNYNLISITTPDPANPDGSTKVTLTANDLINGLNGSTLTRAQVLRAIVQSDQVTQNLETVNAFVASQYYGYLRRSPDTTGFNDWVNYLKANPNDFRTMVHGFLDSSEYRLRFGPL